MEIPKRVVTTTTQYERAHSTGRAVLEYHSMSETPTPT
jgi:hypothetical protein